MWHFFSPLNVKQYFLWYNYDVTAADFIGKLKFVWGTNTLEVTQFSSINN